MSVYMSVPLDQPLPGATFGQAVNRFFKKYATFSGRASRSEYWWVQLFLWLVGIVPAILIGMGSANMAYGEGPSGIATVGMVLAGILSLAFLIPSLALIWRRLHDANLSGAFFFLVLIPGVGSLVLFVLMILPSNPMGVRFDRS